MLTKQCVLSLNAWLLIYGIFLHELSSSRCVFTFKEKKREREREREKKKMRIKKENFQIAYDDPMYL